MTGFFKTSGTSATTESTIQAQVDSASTSATNAATSATAAAASATSAATAKTGAETAKTASVTAQGASETAQAASEAARDLAEGYRDTAETHKDNAASSATSASTSAATATTKASEASTSASTASTKASEASTSATSAASSLSDFQALYRTGATDPTTSLDTGDLFFNSSTGTLKVYTGSAWEAGVTAGSGFLATTGGALSGNLQLNNANLIFEGSTADDFETTLTVTDPTADRTITLPNSTGTVALTSSDITGNAATATALETARTIAGQSFDGSANISIAPTDLTSVTATASEINILDGVTATTAELNLLDGVTATTTEINYIDGVTSSIQTQIDNIASDLVDDTSPQLGGNLDVNGNSIVSTSNGDISITPNGTGSVVIDGLSHPQSDGSSGQFLKTDGAGNLSFATVSASSDLVDDTTPQLGGDLDTNGNAILFGSSKWSIELDTDNDLLFKYNGSTVFKIASDGALTSADDITAFGSP